MLANAAALVVASWIVPGIHLATSDDLVNDILTVLVVALIFGLVNSLVKPILKLLSLPVVILTLGLFLLILNAAMLMLTSWLSGQFGLGFSVDGLWPAVLGSIVISIVSGLVGGVIGAQKK